MEKLKIKFKGKYLCIFVAFLTIPILYFMSSSQVFAAELILGKSNNGQVQNFTAGDEFLLNVILNTDGESANAAQAEINFPTQILDLKETRLGGSIVSFWVVQPKLSQAGVVSFSGIIPGGYTGTSGLIMALVFSAKSVGEGVIGINNAQVLLNDGKGTQASLKTLPLKFSVSNLKNGAAVQPTVEPLKDAEPPDGFTPEVVQNSEMFDKKYFLVFSAQDRGSGIDHYEVYESNSEIKNLTNVKWNIAESPYVLQDQKLQSFIYVKAIDGEGNGRIEAVGPRYSIKWYGTWWFWFRIIIMVIIIGTGLATYYLLKKFLWRRKIVKL